MVAFLVLALVYTNFSIKEQAVFTIVIVHHQDRRGGVKAFWLRAALYCLCITEAQIGCIGAMNTSRDGTVRMPCCVHKRVHETSCTVTNLGRASQLNSF